MDDRPARKGQRRVSWLAIVLLLLTLGAGAAVVLAPEAFYGIVDRVIAQIERVSR